MGAASKKRKTAVQKYHCTSCMTDRAASVFPEYNPTETCQHLINTCKKCLREWIEVQLESTVFAGGLKCPECPEMMKRSDVEMAVTRNVFKRYDEFERRWIAETTPGWRWCLNPKCRSGQVHESPPGSAQQPIEIDSESKENSSKPSDSQRGWFFDIFGNRQPVKAPPSSSPPQNTLPTSSDICTCNTCGSRACVPCDRPWHEGETCAQYQARIKDRLEEEDASLKAVQKRTKPCPRCARPIEKNGGCSYMRCSQCQVNFCWVCMWAFGEQGTYCKCHPGGPGH